MMRGSLYVRVDYGRSSSATLQTGLSLEMKRNSKFAERLRVRSKALKLICCNS